MPWINQDMCTGCGICVAECVVGAITMEDQNANINDDECIRCGVCHDVCPSDAVRHDGEKVQEEIEANLAWVKSLLQHSYYLNDEGKQKELIQRLKRYFNKTRKIAEKTIEELKKIEETEDFQAAKK